MQIHLYGVKNSSGISWTEVLRAFKRHARVKGFAIIKGRILSLASKLLEDDKCALTVASTSRAGLTFVLVIRDRNVIKVACDIIQFTIEKHSLLDT